MVGEHALAQDLFQEALTKTYIAWPRLRAVENAEARRGRPAGVGPSVEPHVTVHRDYPFAVVTGWVDADTAMVFAITTLDGEDSYAFDLLSCDIPSGDCDVVNSGAFAREVSFVAPVGDPMT